MGIPPVPSHALEVLKDLTSSLKKIGPSFDTFTEALSRLERKVESYLGSATVILAIAMFMVFIYGLILTLGLYLIN